MSDQLLELVKQIDPVDADEIRRRPVPQEQLVAIMSAGRVRRSVTPRGPRLRRARLIPMAAAGAALVAVVVASLPGRGGGASPEAAQALESVAAIASADVSPGRTGGFAYYKLTHADVAGTGDRNPYSWYEPVTIEQWVAPDGSGRVRTVRRPVEWPGPRDRERWRRADHGPLPKPRTSDERFAPGGLDGRPSEGALPPVRELPADPDRLLEIFEEEAGISSSSVPVNVKSFEYATSVLLQAGSSPELRAALYEVVADIDGVQLTGDARDPRGRPGLAVSIDSDYTGAARRYTLIFDPETSQPLAYTENLLEPQDWIDARVLAYTVLEESGHVTDIGSRP